LLSAMLSLPPFLNQKPNHKIMKLKMPGTVLRELREQFTEEIQTQRIRCQNAETVNRELMGLHEKLKARIAQLENHERISHNTISDLEEQLLQATNRADTLGVRDRQHGQHIAALQLELHTVRSKLGLFEDLAKLPPTESHVLGVLALAHDDTNWWRAVLHILRRQTTTENEAACSPNLSSEARHYNAGRAAALIDHLDCLLQLQAKAQRQNEEAA
jgi:hypothetical protein